jgi:hypothetical protein
MTTTHTPGPWRVGDAGHTVFGPKTNNPSPKTVASNLGKEDARLIAAAPELLEALKLLFKEVEIESTESMLDGPIGDALAKAHDVIAKAEGK